MRSGSFSTIGTLFPRVPLEMTAGGRGMIGSSDAPAYGGVLSVRECQRQRLSARQAMQHVDVGRTLYHTTLCRCCHHERPASSSPPASVTSLAAPGKQLQIRTESQSPPPPSQCQFGITDDIPLDISKDSGPETAVIDALKGRTLNSSANFTS